MTREAGAESLDQLTALRPYARRVLLIGVTGLVALATSFLTIGDFRILLVAVAYVGGLCVVSFGYTYASFTWRIPKLQWFGIVPPLIAGLIYGAFRLMGQDKLNAILQIAWWGWWGICLLVGLAVLGAVAGWFAYWRDLKPNGSAVP